jgi:hypothetical protein
LILPPLARPSNVAANQQIRRSTIMANIPFETNGTSSTLDATQLLDAGRRSANVLTAAAGLVAKTMSDIIAKQTDLLRSEGSEIAKSAAAFGGSLEPVEAVENYVAAVRGGAEGMLSNLRDIQDLMRGCAWGLFGLYVDSFSVAAGNGRPVHH